MSRHMRAMKMAKGQAVVGANKMNDLLHSAVLAVSNGDGGCQNVDSV